MPATPEIWRSHSLPRSAQKDPRRSPMPHARRLSLLALALMLGACSTPQPVPLPPLPILPEVVIPTPKPPAQLLEPPSVARTLPGSEKLTPDQLYEGYTNLGEDYRYARALAIALQNWIKERFPEM